MTLRPPSIRTVIVSVLLALVALAGSAAAGFPSGRLQGPARFGAAAAPLGVEGSELLPVGVTIQTLLTNMNKPTAMAFDPQGRLFYSEKDGSVRLFANGTLQATPVITISTEITGELGIMGLALDPNFTSNHYVYVHYNCGPNVGCPSLVNRVGRFTENNGVGSNLVTIFDTPQTVNEFGGEAIHFGPDGKLYISVGWDSDDAKPQDVTSTVGKMHRINADGTMPLDNPVFTQTGALPSLYAIGLRNTFDFTFDPVTPGRIFASENGPHCDDEMNRIEPGYNYGWRPNYPCDDPSPDPTYNTIPPLWSLGTTGYGPCCKAPTGITVYTGYQIPQWKNDLFMITWIDGRLHHMYLDPQRTSITASNIIQTVVANIAATTGPDGALWYIEGGGFINGNLKRIVGPGTPLTPVPSNTPAPPANTNTAVPPTSTPVPPTATPLQTPTDTPVLPVGTSSPTDTPTTTPTNTNTSIPTATSVPTSTPPGPGIIFSDGFESGSFSNWSATVLGPAAGSVRSVNTGASFSGVFGAQLSNGVGGTQSNGSSITKSFTSPSNQVVSAQTRLKVNSLSGTGTLRLLQLRDSVTGQAVVRVRYSNGIAQLLLVRRNLTQVTANFATNLGTGSWHLIELMYDWSGVQPVGKVWVDGVLQASITDTTTGTTIAPNTFFCMVYEDAITASGDAYFDDVRLANGFIGNGVPPTTTPAPSSTPTAVAPSPTNTRAPISTSTPTSTPVQAPPTDTSTSTPVLPSNTPVPTNTSTTIPPSTPTSTPTSTSTSTSTPTTVISTPTPTSTPSGGPGIIFSDGFESGNFSNWSATVLGPAASSVRAVTSAAAFSGVFGAQLSNGVGGTQSNGSSISKTFIPLSNQIISAQTRLKVNSLAGTGTLRLLQLRDSVTGQAVVRVRYANGVAQLLLVRRNLTQVTANFTTNMSVGSWHLIELMYDWSGVQPVGKVWVDGVLQASITDTTTGTTIAPNTFFCMVYEDAITASGDAYFDDVRLANGFIGP